MIPRVDTTAADVIHYLVNELAQQGFTLVIARPAYNLRADLDRLGLLDGRIEVVASVTQGVLQRR